MPNSLQNHQLAEQSVGSHYINPPLPVMAPLVGTAWQPRAGLPGDQWKMESLRDMLEQWLELKSSGVEEEEHGRLLSHYIHTLCKM